MKYLIVLIFICSSCMGFYEERHGFKDNEPILVNGKFKGFAFKTKSIYNENLIMVEWIDAIGNRHFEPIDYRFLSHEKIIK